MTELVALLDGQEIGLVSQRAGRLSLLYHDTWQRSPSAYPLSLSLPLAAREHGHAPVNAFLWGLLPDNERVLERWGRQFQVSPGNPFALLSAVGEDCAGAVQLVAKVRVAELEQTKAPDVQWLSRRDVAARLRTLIQDNTAWRGSAEEGQFSLAGAQPKTALYLEKGRWGVPRGRTPTTHILKPTLPILDGHAENEHLCLSLAQSLELATATSRVQHFEEVSAIVVERYDRVSVGGVVRRVHQEDLCQALGLPPTKKYQADGGPSVLQIVELLRAAAFAGDGAGQPDSAAETDVWAFLDALAFSWLIGGTDAHAKNYSLLIGPGRVRLAPLYNVASIYAYPDVNPKKAKLAMKVAGKYRIEEIHLPEWRSFAQQLRVDPDALVTRVRELSRDLPDHLSMELSRMRKAGLDHPALARVEREVTKRARRYARMD